MLGVIVLVLFICAVPGWSATIPESITKANVVYEKQLKEYLQTVPATVADEALMTVPELIRSKGYPAEKHKVETEDGYILEMHRIPYGIDGDSENRPVAFLQHGLISSSADWVVPGPQMALAYILADEGYDVWMGNERGNKYSRHHITYDPDKDGNEFWNFDWHEIGIYDLPAMIDFVLEQTGQTSVYYIGHSQGTTSFYVMASEKPEYNEKIKVQISLAPIAFMNHMTSPLFQFLSLFNGPLEVLANLIGINEFLPSSEFLANAGDFLCSDDSLTQLICTNSLFLICGFDADQFNATILPIIMGHTPAGASTHQLLHYSQEIRSGNFRQYDHGMILNLMYYASIFPPEYDLSKVTAPVYLFYSKNDWLAAVEDVNKLYEQLGNPQAKLLVSDESFNHLDYLYAMEALSLVYPKVIDVMSKF